VLVELHGAMLTLFLCVWSFLSCWYWLRALFLCVWSSLSCWYWLRALFLYVWSSLSWSSLSCWYWLVLTVVVGSWVTGWLWQFTVSSSQVCMYLHVVRAIYSMKYVAGGFDDHFLILLHQRFPCLFVASHGIRFSGAGECKVAQWHRIQGLLWQWVFSAVV